MGATKNCRRWNGVGFNERIKQGGNLKKVGNSQEAAISVEFEFPANFQSSLSSISTSSAAWKKIDEPFTLDVTKLQNLAPSARISLIL